MGTRTPAGSTVFGSSSAFGAPSCPILRRSRTSSQTLFVLVGTHFFPIVSHRKGVYRDNDPAKLRKRTSQLPTGSLLLIIFWALVAPYSAWAQPVAPSSAATYASPHPAQGGQFGAFMAAVGDLNGDKTTDVIVGAPRESVDGTTRAGRAYLLSGADGTVLHALTAPTVREWASFGTMIADVGDVNRDGTPDVLVDAAYGKTSEIERAHLFSGASGEVLRVLSTPPLNQDASYNLSATGVGDLNGDEAADILVGVDGAGQAFLFDGAEGTILREFHSPSPRFIHFGVSVTSGAGSTPFPMYVGAPDDSLSGKPYAGQVYLFGATNAEQPRTIASPTPDADGDFGEAIATLPPPNENASPRLLVGAPGENRAYLFGGSSKEVLHTFAPSSRGTARRFGHTVGAAGDLTGDGHSEILVAAPRGQHSNRQRAGRVHLYDGDEGEILHTYLPPTSGTGTERGGGFGSSFAVVRSANSGAPRALLVGRPSGGADESGRVYRFRLP